MHHPSCLILFLAACILLSVNLSAEARGVPGGKRLESNFQIAAGVYSQSGSRADIFTRGLAVNLSYGLDIRLDERWSLMPGIGARLLSQGILEPRAVGADHDDFNYYDLFLCARYRYETEGTRFIVSLGPEVSREIFRDTYFLDADPSDPRNNVVKVKPYDFGLRPAWAVEVGRHWRFGVEGHIGLRNVLTQRNDLNLTGSLHLHDITAAVCFYF